MRRAIGKFAMRARNRCSRWPPPAKAGSTGWFCSGACHPAGWVPRLRYVVRQADNMQKISCAVLAVAAMALASGGMARAAATQPNGLGRAGTRVPAGSGRVTAIKSRLALRGSHSALNGVAVLSRRSVWAVGGLTTANGMTPLIEHWNGRRWRQMRAVSPGGSESSNLFYAVAAVSPRDVWAVGQGGKADDHPLIEHWN